MEAKFAVQLYCLLARNRYGVQGPPKWNDEYEAANDMRSFASRVAIITPYRRQQREIRKFVQLVREELRQLQRSRQNKELQSNMPSTYGFEELEINTIDGFQGREKEVVILSCVRANRLSKSRWHCIEP